MTDTAPTVDPIGPPAPDAPPTAKRGRGRPPKGTGRPDTPPASPKGPGRPSADSKLIADLAGTLGMIGIGVSAFNQVDGMIVLSGAEDVATSLVHISARNPALRRTLERLTAVSAYGELTKALAIIAIPIMVNHGALPVDTLKFVPLDDDLKAVVTLKAGGVPDADTMRAAMADMAAQFSPGGAAGAPSSAAA